MINQNWYHSHDYYLEAFYNSQNVTLNENQTNLNYINNINGNRKFYEELQIPCCDNTILFIYYYLQCIITIIIFSLYTPFKKDLSENKYLIFYLVGNALFAIYIIFIYNSLIYEFFGLVIIESQNFKFTLLVVAIINFFASLYTEKNLLKYEEEKNDENDIPVPINNGDSS